MPATAPAAAPPPPPSWPHPRLRLAVGDEVLDAAGLVAEAQILDQSLEAGDGLVAVEAGNARTLAAALIWLWRRRRGTLRVCRRPIPDDDGQPLAWMAASGTRALIRADGAIVTAPLAPLEAAQTPTRPATVILETSGTTGAPKAVPHRLGDLIARIHPGDDAAAVWLLSYDAGGFAGLQVLLTAMTAGHLLVTPPVSQEKADIPTLAALAERWGVTHLSGTPSFWRGLLMTGAEPPLRALTLGGETADQGLLDRLAARFPAARIRHIYASTELGSVFAVGDGRAGFPAAWLEDRPAPPPPAPAPVPNAARRPRLRVDGGRLWVCPPTGGDWSDTGDAVAIRGDRVLFLGRADGTLNIGGTKVAPEEVEGLILAQAGVADAAVIPHPSPLTGWILTAEVVIMPGADEAGTLAGVRAALAPLPAAARPRRLAVVAALTLAASGKKRRAPAPVPAPVPATASTGAGTGVETGE